MVHMIDRYMPQLRAHVAYAAAQRIVAHLAPARLRAWLRRTHVSKLDRALAVGCLALCCSVPLTPTLDGLLEYLKAAW